MDDPVTEEAVADWAESTLQEWLHKHYTPPLDDGHQRRVKLVDDDRAPKALVFSVRDISGHRPERRFKVTVKAEELK